MDSLAQPFSFPWHVSASDEVRQRANVPLPSCMFAPNRTIWISVFAIVIAASIGFGVFAVGNRERNVTVFDYQVVNEFPHDSKAYCQGLAFDDGKLFEGTGQYGESNLREVDLESGRVVRQVDLDRRVFGEGITVLNDRIYQLTWKKRTAFVYDKETFRPIARHNYSGQGWGITNDGTHLIMSDGTSTLRFLDPDTFRLEKKLHVHSQRRSVKNLNELEFINGEIWANVWFRDYIVRIAPKTGEVTSIVDLTELFPAHRRPRKNRREAVLNGIAFDAEDQRIFVTGKYWSRLFEIKVAQRR